MEKTIPSSVPRFQRPEKDETTTTRPSRSEKRSDWFGPSAETAEDSPQLERICSSGHETRSIPARKAASIQLGSWGNRNTSDTERNIPEDELRESKVSEPLPIAQAEDARIGPISASLTAGNADFSTHSETDNQSRVLKAKTHQEINQYLFFEEEMVFEEIASGFRLRCQFYANFWPISRSSTYKQSENS